MNSRATGRTKSGAMLVQKMFELENAYRDINDRDRELLRYRGGAPESVTSRSGYDRDDEREKELIKLRYTVSKMEDRLKVSRVETENAKRELKDEQEGRKVVDKKIKALEKENKDLKNKMSSLRVKLGVANANYNVGKHETDDLRKNHQENQIQIARLEERLAAANQELERLRNPLNPTGSEEVKRKINSDKRQLKALKVELQKMEELRSMEEKNQSGKDEEIRHLQQELNIYRLKVANLETSLEMAEITVQAERASREDFEKQNQQLLQEKTNFDDQIKEFKVKLGIAQASKNVNVRQAVLLRKQDEEYQYTVQNLEKRLKMANAEIDRLRSQHMEIGQTANSLQNYNTRLKKHRNTFNMEFLAPRSYEGRTGWTPSRLTPRGSQSGERISISSIGSQGTVKSVTSKIEKKKNAKPGRVSAP